MTSAQNHLPRLSGNKYRLLALCLLVLAACSPKIKKPVAKPDVPEKVKEIEKPVEKFTRANISLLIPFKLDQYKLKTTTKAEVEKAAMAIDFYQGFKLGVDSAASLGLNFKLNVYDVGDGVLDLLHNNLLNNSNLIVGPVFPSAIKTMKDYTVSKGIPIVNPLAASHPQEFENPELISVVNNIDLHAAKLGDYISKHYNPAQTVVVLINPKKESDEIMAKPVRSYFAGSKKVFFFQEFASVFTMEMKLVKNKKYVIIVSSPDRKFVIPTLDKLMKMKKAGLNVDLFGHPDWIKDNYNTDKLQALNTTVTSSYKVDYTRPAVNDFIKKYRATFNFEPGEYSFKGFDIGFYFSSLLAKYGKDYTSHMVKDKYIGLHNNFTFYKDDKLGFINTNLMLLRYHDFALNRIE